MLTQNNLSLVQSPLDLADGPLCPNGAFLEVSPRVLGQASTSSAHRSELGSELSGRIAWNIEVHMLRICLANYVTC